jgi:hypothetical protein
VFCVRLAGYPWSLVFSTSQNGFSLNSLYRKMIGIDSPILLVIEDTQGNVSRALFIRRACHTGESNFLNNRMLFWWWTGFWRHHVVRNSRQRIILRHGRIAPLRHQPQNANLSLVGWQLLFYSRQQRKLGHRSRRVSQSHYLYRYLFRYLLTYSPKPTKKKVSF